MTAGFERGLQCAAACVAIGIYAGLTHYANSTPAARDLGTALALAPAAALCMVLTSRISRPAALWGSAALGLLIIGLWPVLRHRFTLVSLIDECGLYGVLGATFLRSLRSGRIAVCTQLADKVHGPLSPAEVSYTRRVTAAWSLFFFGIAGTSAVLYVAAPVRVWSLFSNFCVLPLVGAMFVAEYAVRRRALPQIKRTGILATVRVYLATPHSS